MKTLTISLPDSLAASIEQDVSRHGYEDVSEYVADALRAQQDREHAALEALLLEGVNSGEPIAVNPAFWDGFRAETDALLAARHHRDKEESSAA